MSWIDWQVFFLSAIPITELRFTIPFALAMGLEPFKAYFLAVAGNLMPVVPLLILLEPVSKLLRHLPFLERLFKAILRRTRTRGGRVEKYGVIGLFFFVSLPFPGTGAWTGALLAWLFGLNIIPSAAAIALGVFAAGLIMILGSLGIIKMVVLYRLEYFLLAVLLALMLLYYFKKVKGK